jgi:hypothetical protein
MTKKQMQARIAELEAVVQTLTTAINAMRTPIYVGPAQPVVNPLPYTPLMPYIGDPPYPYGPTTICIGGTMGGLQSQCNMGHQEG